MNKIKELIENLSVLWDWVIAFLKFIGNAVITILSSLGNMFMSVFNGELFDNLNNVLSTLSYYLGSFGAFIFISLFLIVLLILIASFLFRLLRGRVHYTAVLRKDKYNQKHPIK